VFLLQWTFLAVVAGIVGASVLELFNRLVETMRAFLVTTGVPAPVFAAGGALVVGGVIYRISRDAAGEGIPSYLYALQHSRGPLPVLATVMKFPAAVITLGTFGSGGVVGPVGRVVVGLLSLVGASVPGTEMSDERSRTAAICGLAATVAAVFHAPVGGGIFAVEVIQRANMRYRDLFPAVLAGAVSVWFARFVGWSPLISVHEPVIAMDLRVVPWTLAFAVVVGLLAGAFTRGYALTVRLFRRDQGRVVAKVLFGMVAAALLGSIVNPDLVGTAAELTNALANGDLELLTGALDPSFPLAGAALIMLLVRMALSYLTTGSGMSAGLTAPAIQIGMLAGLAAAQLVAPLADPSLRAGFLVVGFSGMLAGAMNVPIAAAMLGMEVFGRSVGIPAAIAAIVAFQMNRHTTIYDYALAGSGHLDES